MSSKFEIIGNNLVVTDTDSSAVVFDQPARESSYNGILIDLGTVKVTFPYVSNKTSGISYSCLLTDAVDSDETAFTEASFRSFARNNLGSIDHDYKYDVSLGLVSDTSAWNKFGYNLDIDTGTTEVIAAFGGTYTPMATAEVLTFVSTSTDDASGGIGARQITVVGVGGDGLPLTEVVTMNGTTNVNTTNTWFGVNRVFVSSAGTGGINAGVITGTSSTYSTQAEVPAGEGVTQQAIFTVPEGYTFMADWLWINIRKLSGGGAPKVTTTGRAYNRTTGVTLEVFRHDIDTALENTVPIVPSQPFNVSEKNVLYFESTTDTNNTVINCRFSGILKKNV